MSRADRVWEEVERRRDLIGGEAEDKLKVEFVNDAEPDAFQDWLLARIELEVNTDADEAHPDYILHIGRGA